MTTHRLSARAADRAPDGSSVRVASARDRPGELGRLRTLLAQLPSDQREVVELACFGELTHAEIAERLAEPDIVVKRRLRAALHVLAEDAA
jgi:RNA polymerase sigma-70 factor (ECF subfamily)